jgi:hypothetical protein
MQSTEGSRVCNGMPVDSVMFLLSPFGLYPSYLVLKLPSGPCCKVRRFVADTYEMVFWSSRLPAMVEAAVQLFRNEVCNSFREPKWCTR